MTKIIKKIAAAVILLSFAAIFICGCSMKKYTYTDMTVFDTQTVIVGYDTSEKSFNSKAQAITDELYRLHRLYDIYYEYDGVTNLKNINDAAGTSPVSADEDIISLLKYCKDICRITNGRTNIAMGSVLRLWHDCRENALDDPENAELPSMEELREAAKHTDIDNVIIDEENGSVFLADSEMSIDVGAVAKGYAAELAAKFIEAKGWNSVALSVGGNVRTAGLKADGAGWETGVQNPDVESDEPYVCKVELGGADALVTSGTYQRYFTLNGVKYHHIIDPDTLMPEYRYLSVTVLCGDSGMGDGLSTALFNMSEEEGRDILTAVGADAAWVYPDGSISYTDGFSKKLVK